MRIFHCFLASGMFAATIAAAADPTPSPTAALTDYLKVKKRPADAAGRKAAFIRQYPTETYAGTTEQDARLLQALLAADKECTKIVDGVCQALKNAPLPMSTIEAMLRFPRWVPAEGFGVNGSYAARVSATVTGGAVADKDFMVAIDTAAAELGKFACSGRAEVLVDGKVVDTFNLQTAWFQTVGPAGSKVVYLYAEKKKQIGVPAGKRVVVRLTLSPTVTTDSGTVSLIPGTGDVTLQK